VVCRTLSGLCKHVTGHIRQAIGIGSNDTPLGWIGRRGPERETTPLQRVGWAQVAVAPLWIHEAHSRAWRYLSVFRSPADCIADLYTAAENILVDPETHQITGLLDFDCSHIASQADEFFYSFMDFGGLVPGPFEGGDLEHLRNYQLHGFPDSASFKDVKMARSCGTWHDCGKMRCTNTMSATLLTL
jgi:hypothetical protein